MLQAGCQTNKSRLWSSLLITELSGILVCAFRFGHVTWHIIGTRIRWEIGIYADFEGVLLIRKSERASQIPGHYVSRSLVACNRLSSSAAGDVRGLHTPKVVVA